MFRFYMMRHGGAKQDSIPGPARRAAAALVHAYTAAGAVLAFVGIEAAFAHDFRTAFAMMFVATIVDATDGVLARAVRVREVFPAVDGARIDDLVDYTTYVLLPMFVAARASLLPPSAVLPVVAAVLLSSAYGFSAADAKTDDHFFTGFPSYWNIVVLYLYLAGAPGAVNATVLAVLSALVFVRIRYVYPTRTVTWRPVTVALGSLWAVAVALVIALLPRPPRALWIGSLFFPVYYLVLSLVLDARRR